jgi:hypothetical protein
VLTACSIRFLHPEYGRVRIGITGVARSPEQRRHERLFEHPH